LIALKVVKKEGGKGERGEKGEKEGRERRKKEGERQWKGERGGGRQLTFFIPPFNKLLIKTFLFLVTVGLAVAVDRRRRPSASLTICFQRFFWTLSNRPRELLNLQKEKNGRLRLLSPQPRRGA